LTRRRVDHLGVLADQDPPGPGSHPSRTVIAASAALSGASTPEVVVHLREHQAHFLV
jgi:hypothetical protein